MVAAAASVATYVPFFKKLNVSRILDYGAGKLRNSQFLYEQGFKVYVADLPEQIQRIYHMPSAANMEGILTSDSLGQQRLGVDLVIANYVLSLLAEQVDVEEFFYNIKQNLRPWGYLLLEEKCRQRLRKCQNCVIPCFYAISLEQLDCLLASLGFRRLGHHYGRISLAVLYQKVR